MHSDWDAQQKQTNKKKSTTKNNLNSSSTDSMCPKLSHLWLHEPVKQTKTGVVLARAHPAVSNLQPHSAFINSTAGSKLTSPVETDINHKCQTSKIQQEDHRRPLASRQHTKVGQLSQMVAHCLETEKKSTLYYWPLKEKEKSVPGLSAPCGSKSHVFLWAAGMNTVFTAAVKIFWFWPNPVCW